MTESVFTNPLRTSSPSETCLGTGSPVMALVSMKLSPDSMTPSIGTISPGLITMVSPTCTVSVLTDVSIPSRMTVVYGTFSPMRALTDDRDLMTARSSKNSPIL